MPNFDIYSTVPRTLALVPTMLHKHRIVPGHVGGTYSKGNVIVLTVVAHAEEHKQLFLKYNRWQDCIAWLTLSGTIGKETAIKFANRSYHTGRKLPQETKDKLSKIRKGKKHSAEHRLNLNKALKGRKFSAEGKEAIRLARLGNQNARGHIVSEESKAKMRAAYIGRKTSDETRNKLSLAAKLFWERRKTING